MKIGKKNLILVALWCIAFRMVAQTAELKNVEVDANAH